MHMCVPACTVCVTVKQLIRCERGPHYKRLLQLLFNEKQWPSRKCHATVMPQINLSLFICEYSEGVAL